MQDRHIISKYFAPRGTKRMYELGMQLGQLYLAPDDKLIGVIGDAGSGKSSPNGPAGHLTKPSPLGEAI